MGCRPPQSPSGFSGGGQGVWVCESLCQRFWQEQFIPFFCFPDLRIKKTKKTHGQPQSFSTPSLFKLPGCTYGVCSGECARKDLPGHTGLCPTHGLSGLCFYITALTGAAASLSPSFKSWTGASLGQLDCLGSNPTCAAWDELVIRSVPQRPHL